MGDAPLHLQDVKYSFHEYLSPYETVPFIIIHTDLAGAG